MKRTGGGSVSFLCVLSASIAIAFRWIRGLVLNRKSPSLCFSLLMSLSVLERPLPPIPLLASERAGLFEWNIY